MRSIIVALIAGLLTTYALAAEKNAEFDASCAWGLAEFGVIVHTNCSVNWVNPKTKKLYCFSSEESMKNFMKNPDENLHKAEAKAAELSKK